MADAILHRLGAWMRRARHLGAYLLVIAVAAAGVWRAQHETSQRLDADCEQRREGRQLLLDVVDLVTDDTGQVPVDLSLVPGFDALDPETQAYFVALTAILNADRPASVEARLEAFAASLDLPDCP